MLFLQPRLAAALHAPRIRNRDHEETDDMARIPYGDESDPEIAALADQIRRERGGKVLNLYRMLLNSPPVASGWLNLLTAIRQKAKLPGKFRELAILRIAVLNGADYEYRAHVPFALKEGATEAQVAVLPDWEKSDAFDAKERSVLAYTDAMTEEVQVSDAVFDAVSKHFDPREMTELTATIAAYNLVSRFLEALKVDHEH
jgi:alkylhydroperoxidase family enzyme